jgi:hypothetical protein
MKHYKIYATVIIALAVVLAITSEWNDSIIVDEVPHIGAGYSYLEKGDMRLNPEHPPLPKDIAAIPLLFLNLDKSAFDTKFWQTDINGQWEFGRYLIYNSGNDADLIRHTAKLPMILFFILSAILVAKWSRRLYGNTGGLLALFIFSLSPTVLAHARFVTTDVAALFAVISATYFFVKYLQQQNIKNFIIAALIFGVALLCKFSTFLLVPFLGLMAMIFGFTIIKTNFTRRFWCAIKYGFISVAIFAVGFVVVVWPVYYLHTMNYPVERQKNDSTALLSSYGNRFFADSVVWMSDKPVIRAAGQYALGLLMVNQRQLGGNTTYFLGQTARDGWHYYFPVVYFLKEPLAWWGLSIIAIIALFTLRRKNGTNNWVQDHFEELTMLIWLVLYWGISIQSTLNIGVRHLMPIYPFAIILVSGQVVKIYNYLRNYSRNLFYGFGALVGVLLFWYLAENIAIYPYYLSYFNQVAGGPSRGYKYVVDSNLDWGQDLVRLSNYVKENNIKKIEVDYFGWADPYYYLKDSYIWLNSKKYSSTQDFINHNKSNGWLAVSATFLMGSEGTKENPNPVNYKNWLQNIKPVTVIGNSIFIYHIK